MYCEIFVFAKVTQIADKGNSHLGKFRKNGPKVWHQGKKYIYYSSFLAPKSVRSHFFLKLPIYELPLSPYKSFTSKKHWTATVNLCHYYLCQDSVYQWCTFTQTYPWTLSQSLRIEHDRFDMWFCLHFIATKVTSSFPTSDTSVYNCIDFFIISCISGRGHRIGAISLCVRVSMCVSICPCSNRRTAWRTDTKFCVGI